MAGRWAPVAPYLYVDLSRDRAGLSWLSAFQRQLQAGSFCPARSTRRVAHGVPLFFLRTETTGNGSLQPAAEACLHVRNRAGCPVSSNRLSDMEACAVFLVGVDDGRFPSCSPMAFSDHVGDTRILVRTPGDGGPARLE